jgi:hypothetical protein
LTFKIEADWTLLWQERKKNIFQKRWAA